MRPIKGLFPALALSAALVAAGGWLAGEIAPTASRVPDAFGDSAGVSSARPIGHDGVQIEVRGVRSSDGRVVVTVYDDPDALAQYDDRRAVAHLEIPASLGTLLADFPELKSGRYAVTLFHDENADGDFNMTGEMPLEGYGTSGAGGPYDEPGFERASITPGRSAVAIYYLQ